MSKTLIYLVLFYLVQNHCFGQYYENWDPISLQPLGAVSDSGKVYFNETGDTILVFNHAQRCYCGEKIDSNIYIRYNDSIWRQMYGGKSFVNRKSRERLVVFSSSMIYQNDSTFIYSVRGKDRSTNERFNIHLDSFSLQLYSIHVEITQGDDMFSLKYEKSGTRWKFLYGLKNQKKLKGKEKKYFKNEFQINLNLEEFPISDSSIQYLPAKSIDYGKQIDEDLKYR
ncbi:hypothetical protein SAMN05216474_1773 [Lishizhenia tianjinensis]|uniref:Uncharacterized protein n=1 Tax=Lishizhenia tianjinensis TaxID=477690 RepID=A0A1I7A013_9FLAO|nr:hypothetical protein [Lishizhenia tianjinensis]SFT68244.1 hypothetical protein SAMN05216474_1773 [Lishizhenia tianjinensis]